MIRWGSITALAFVGTLLGDWVIGTPMNQSNVVVAVILGGFLTLLTDFGGRDRS